MQSHCPIVGRMPQHAASTSAYLALSSAMYPSSSRLVHLSNASPVFLEVFNFVVFPGDDTSVISCPADVPCPGPLPSSHLFNHVCDLGLFLTQMFVFLSGYVVFNVLLPSFVCAAASLSFALVVSAHVSASYVIAGSTHELSLQACSSVTFEVVAVLGEC